MSNKPRKKKKYATPHSGPTDYFPFDNYKQFEKSMDDIILLMDRNLKDFYPSRNLIYLSLLLFL